MPGPTVLSEYLDVRNFVPLSDQDITGANLLCLRADTRHTIRQAWPPEMQCSTPGGPRDSKPDSAGRKSVRFERGNINTPFELAVRNQIDRFSIAIDAIDRVPRLKVAGAHAKDRFKNEQIACVNYGYENGIDEPEIVKWRWPY